MFAWVEWNKCNAIWYILEYVLNGKINRGKHFNAATNNTTKWWWKWNNGVKRWNWIIGETNITTKTRRTSNLRKCSCGSFSMFVFFFFAIEIIQFVNVGYSANSVFKLNFREKEKKEKGRTNGGKLFNNNLWFKAMNGRYIPILHGKESHSICILFSIHSICFLLFLCKRSSAVYFFYLSTVDNKSVDRPSILSALYALLWSGFKEMNEPKITKKKKNKKNRFSLGLLLNTKNNGQHYDPTTVHQKSFLNAPKMYEREAKVGRTRENGKQKLNEIDIYIYFCYRLIDQ